MTEDSDITRAYNKINSLNLALEQELSELIEHMQEAKSKAMEIHESDEMAEIDEIAKKLKERSGGLSQEDADMVSKIEEEDHVILEETRKAIKLSQDLREITEELEQRAEKVMEDVGGLGRKRSI